MGTAKTMLASAALALAACQPTIGDAPGIGSGIGRPDAGGPAGGGSEPPPDAEPPDQLPDAGSGVPSAVLLTQTSSDQVLDQHSIGCVEQDEDDNPVQNRENSYYRVFDLAEHGVEGDLEVSSVTFGVESASTPDGSGQPATVRLHTLEGDLRVSGLTEVVSKLIDIQPQAQTSLEVPIAVTVPAGSTLVFELFIPNSTENRLFFIGSNDLGESEPGYLRAPSSGCDFIEPTDFEDVGGADFPDVHIVMMVSGTDVPAGAGLTESGTPARAAPRPVSVW